MSDDERPGRDPEVARALEGIPVPDYAPGFWDRLDARLEHEGAPGRLHEVRHMVVVPPVAPPVGQPEPRLVEPLDLPLVAPVALPRRDRRRSITVLVAAAAAVLAILAVRLGDPTTDDLQVAGPTDHELGQGPDDGTTTPDASPEHDGAGRPEDQARHQTDAPVGGASDEASDAPQILLTPGTTVAAGGQATGTGPAGATIARPRSAEDAFLQWATAIDEGDTATAAALTGPRSAAYYEAIGSSVEEMAAESQEGYGVWADPDGRHLELVELGQVDGDRAVGVVLDRPADDPEDADGRAYDGVPVVLGDDGWQVEPAAFDPTQEGRIEVVEPTPGPTGLQPMAKGGTIRVSAKRTGEYFLSLDGTQTTRIQASEAEDGEIRWTPSALRSSSTTRHVLVVAHLDRGEVAMVAQAFETTPG